MPKDYHRQRIIPFRPWSDRHEKEIRKRVKASGLTFNDWAHRRMFNVGELIELAAKNSTDELKK